VAIKIEKSGESRKIVYRRQKKIICVGHHYAQTSTKTLEF
jgi:hypothetical protein